MSINDWNINKNSSNEHHNDLLVDEIMIAWVCRPIDRSPSNFNTISKKKVVYRFCSYIKSFYIWEILKNVHCISRYESIYLISHLRIFKKKSEKQINASRAVRWILLALLLLLRLCLRLLTLPLLAPALRQPSWRWFPLWLNKNKLITKAETGT